MVLVLHPFHCRGCVEVPWDFAIYAEVIDTVFPPPHYEPSPQESASSLAPISFQSENFIYEQLKNASFTRRGLILLLQALSMHLHIFPLPICSLS